MSWKDDIKSVIQSKWRVGQIFILDDVYEYKNEFTELYPDNEHITDKVRQILQYLRDDGIIEFIDNNGTYRRLV